jgi:hypothetical protein
MLASSRRPPYTAGSIACVGWFSARASSALTPHLCHTGAMRIRRIGTCIPSACRNHRRSRSTRAWPALCSVLRSSCHSHRAIPICNCTAACAAAVAAAARSRPSYRCCSRPPRRCCCCCSRPLRRCCCCSRPLRRRRSLLVRRHTPSKHYLQVWPWSPRHYGRQHLREGPRSPSSIGRLRHVVAGCSCSWTRHYL